MKPPPHSTSEPPVQPRSTIHANHRKRFYRRFAKALGLSGALIGVSLLVGMLGYHFIAGFVWIDSFLNATMILTGMGPVGALPSDGAKIFASVYALFSGVVFITATGLILSPMFHRVLHRFNLEQSER